jgi:hypothetical protein
MSNGYVGQTGLSSAGGEYNAHRFLVWQLLGLVGTVKVVKVIAVHAAGGLAVGGTVDVQPLTNQIDGQGNSTPHGTVFGLPYIRLQGGANAVIIDPVAGDIGLAVIADRDISAVKSKRGQANPGSFRRFDMADGIFLGGILNAVPEQYVEFIADGGLKLADKFGNSLTSSAEGWALVGNLAVTGDITATGEITKGLGGSDSVTVGGHTHPDPQGGNVGPPNPGT